MATKKYHFLPCLSSSGPTAFASMEFEQVCRNVTLLAFGPVMFVSCVPIAMKNTPLSSHRADTARPTAELSPPVMTSTLSCEIKRFVSVEPVAGTLASSPLTISYLMRLFFFVASATATSIPCCCDAAAAAYTPEKLSM